MACYGGAVSLMTSDKDLYQNFSEFRGLDVRSSDLSRPQNAAKEIKNFIIEKNFGLGGEKGLQLFADRFDAVPIVGLHNYISKDPETSQETQELLALGKALWRLKEGEFSISYSGSGTWGYAFYLESDGEFNFKLYEDSVAILDYSVGTGLEDDSTGVVNLSTVEALIDAKLNFAAASDTTVDAIVAASFPLSASYDLAPGAVSIPVYYWEKITSPFNTANDPTEDLFSPYLNSHDDITVRPPVFLNNHNCCYIACDGRTPLMKYDGARVCGAGMVGLIPEDVEILPITNGTALVGSYRYYIRLAKKDAKGNFIYGRGVKSDVVTTSSGEAPRITMFDIATTTKGMGATNYLIDIGTDTTTSGSTNTVTLDSAIDESALSFYGHEKLRPGDIITLVGGITSPTVVERAIVSIDRAAKEIVLDGPAFTLSGAGTTVSWGNLYAHAPIAVFSNTTQSNVSTITVAGNTTAIGVGTYLFFQNEQEWYKVTATTTTTITIDGIVSTPSSTYYITDTAVEIYRTEDEGLEKFYLSKRIAASFNISSGSGEFDTTADTDLGIELTIPDKEPDYLREFPAALCKHQELNIVGGGSTRTGRIIYEDFEYIEGFPLATNFFDVPSQDTGILTALWSDSYDQLAVFKDTAYYSIVGSFRDEVPILNTDANTEDDLGVACQSSLLKIRGINIGIGKLGFIAFKNGSVDYELTKQLDSEFLSGAVGDVFTESQKLRVNRAVAVNDKFKQQAYFFVPAFDVTSGVHYGANSNSKMFVFDYSEQAWTRRAFPSDLSVDSSGLIPYPFYPTAGMVNYQDRLFFMANAYDSTHGNGDHTDFTGLLFRRKERAVLPSGISDYRHDYSDQHAAIGYDFKAQWIFGDTPSIDRMFHHLELYTFNTSDFVPFDLRIRTYIDWDESTVIDDITISVTSTTPNWTVKLSPVRAKALIVRLSTEAILQKPTIIGYELIPGETNIGLEVSR